MVPAHVILVFHGIIGDSENAIEANCCHPPVIPVFIVFIKGTTIPIRYNYVLHAVLLPWIHYSNKEYAFGYYR